MANMPELIQKLIAHEQSARAIGNLAEAEAFATKIADLMFRHNLSMSDVEIKQQERDEPIDKEFVRMGGNRALWMEMLASAVATACFCRHRIVLGSDTQVFIGRTSDRAAASALFRHLVGCAVSIQAKEKLALRDRNPFIEARARQKWAAEWGKAFLLGFAKAVSDRLRVQRHQLTGETGGSALVLRKDNALRMWEAQQQKGKPARALKIKIKATGGYEAGIRAGQNVTLKPHAQLRG